jgi:hypothetical protein
MPSALGFKTARNVAKIAPESERLSSSPLPVYIGFFLGETQTRHAETYKKREFALWQKTTQDFHCPFTSCKR